MLHHIDFEEHEYVNTKTVPQLATVADKWVQRFIVENATDSASSSSTLVTDVPGNESELPMGWAIAKRCQRRLTVVQKKCCLMKGKQLE